MRLNKIIFLSVFSWVCVLAPDSLVSRDRNEKGKKAKESPHLLLTNFHYEGACSGMFSIFSYIVGCLDLYERGEFEGITLNFGEIGLYYEKERGPDWWSYYCEPIEIGKKSNRKYYSHSWYDAAMLSYYVEFNLSRERVHELIVKYIHFKPHIQSAVDKFYFDHFSSKQVIGIHYRGTDKSIEAPRVPFERVKEEIEKYISSQALSDFLIYVATDEKFFLDYMISEFSEKVIFIQAERSVDSQPLHFTTKAPYQQGYESLLDCILLSKSDILMRTSSNLSLWSTYLNPDLPVLSLSQRY